MKTAAELKLEARRALTGNYGNAAGAVLIMYLIAFLLMIPFIIVVFMANMIVNDSNMQMTVIIYATLVVTIVYMVLFLALMMGYIRLCYRIAVGEGGEISDLFYALKNHFLRYLGLVGLMLLYSILSCVPGILVMILFLAVGHPWIGFLVGYLLILAVGVIVLCRYTMALLVLVENPQMRVMESMRFSRDLMQGNVWRFIRLEFSFLGILVLANMTAGIGYLWIAPYMVCTNVLFYLAIKEEKYPPVFPA